MHIYIYIVTSEFFRSLLDAAKEFEQLIYLSEAKMTHATYYLSENCSFFISLTET